MLYDFVRVLCMVFLLALVNRGISQQLSPPAPDFSRHSLVQPTVHHGRTKREISSTRDTNGEHHSEVTISIKVDGEEYELDLHLNKDLLTKNHVISYQDGDKTVIHRPKKEELDLCQYSGTVRGKPDSRVAISTCHGIRGVIFHDERTKFIEPAEGSDLKSFHYVYDNFDYISNYRCGNDDRSNNYTNHKTLLKEHDSEDLQRIRASRYKRNAPRNTEFHLPYNANSKSRYVELVLVVDKAVYNALAGRGTNIKQKIHRVNSQMKEIANVLNSVYSPLNIFVVLVGVEIWNHADKIIINKDSLQTLDNFVSYRKNILVDTISHDNAHFITNTKFDGAVVGKAYTRVICTKKRSAGIAYLYTKVLSALALSIAHEMGHNFGMDHDESPDCKCPDEKCIMFPTTLSNVRHFSTCSLTSLTLTFEMGFDSCLRNKPERLFDSPTCGNGFVEAGEQCDCGLPEPGARSACRACCHSDTCMLRANATCGAGTCCDLQSCRPRSAGTVCRAAERDCDLPEYCTGHSEYCPDDVHKMDTTPCGKNTAYCVRGSCRSHADQCRLLWGMGTKSCGQIQYEMFNAKGTEYGNCGHSRGSFRTYNVCTKRDALCGSLHCLQLDKTLEYGTTVDNSLRYNNFIYNDTSTICTVVEIDLGHNEVDAGMVPDGAKCGEDKMCLRQRCLPVAAVRADVARQHGNICPSDCSGHGICNSKGNCHCELGFAPPLCAEPGPGGSFDSGPASDPTVLWKFMVAMYIIFLGVVPLVALVLLGVYYWRHLATWCQHKLYVPFRDYPPTSNSTHPTPSRTNPTPSSTGVTVPSHPSTLPSQPSTRTTLPSPRSTRFVMLAKQNASLHQLLSSSRDTEPDTRSEDSPIYETLKDIREQQITDHRYQTKTPLKKINNDDIRIVRGDAKVRLPVLPKPVLNSSQSNRTKIVIVNQGLATTTNELIANMNQIHKLNNVRNNNVYENVRPKVKVQNIKK